MHFSLRTALALLASASIASGACGGNVVVDGKPGSTGTGGTTTTSPTTTTGFGAAPSTTTTTGFGAAPTTTTDVATSTAATSTTGTGGGACVNAKAFYGAPFLFPDIEVPCAMANLGNPSGFETCVENKDVVSSACAACLAADIECAAQNCASPCLPDPGSEACITCRNANCAAQFIACSGQPRDTGTLHCADVFGNGPMQTPWQPHVLPAFWATDAAGNAYIAFNQCACDLTCEQFCNPDYCNGQPAGAKCAACLAMACGSQMMTCQAN